MWRYPCANIMESQLQFEDPPALQSNAWSPDWICQHYSESTESTLQCELFGFLNC